MRELLKYIKGDKYIWALVVVLGLVSFLPIYSASTNLVYVIGKGSTIGHFVKHIFLLSFGLTIVYIVQRIPYRLFGKFSNVMMIITSILLVYTLYIGKSSGGATNASRWIHIPFVGLGFQPSILAVAVVMIFTASYLSKNKDKEIGFKESFIQFWIPVGFVLMLIFPADLSTAALIFVMVVLLMLIGKYPLKYILYIVGTAFFVLSMYVLVNKAFPNLMRNRVDTWESRLMGKDSMQAEKAKMAIATGAGIVGVLPGKSVQKNFLPQSSSDFIFAIIVEEMGWLGVFFVIALHLMLFIRIVIVAKKASSVFSTLLVVALGLPIICQTMINIGVAVCIFPVTGQPLPFISAGGTSIVVTCMSIGIILNVSEFSDKKQEIKLGENPLDILYQANQ